MCSTALLHASNVLHHMLGEEGSPGRLRTSPKVSVTVTSWPPMATSLSLLALHE
jgi:hypothetical protein